MKKNKDEGITLPITEWATIVEASKRADEEAAMSAALDELNSRAEFEAKPSLLNDMSQKNRDKEGVLTYDPSDFVSLTSVATAIHVESLKTYPLLEDGTVNVNSPPIFLGDQSGQWLKDLSNPDARTLSRMENSSGERHAQSAVAYGKFPDA